MSDWLFKIAALICALAFLAHEILGSPMVLTPLQGSGIDEEVIWLHNFSWHVGSVTAIAMSGMFLYSSVRPGNLALAVVATLMSIGQTVIGVGLAVFASSALWGTPAPYIWSIVSVLGVIGIWISSERKST